MDLRFQGVAANLLLIVAMKLIGQYTTFQFANFNNYEYEMRNDSCQLRGPNDSFTANPTMRIMRSGYVLAAGGGLISNKYLGFRTVLSLGGALMTLAIGLMTISVWLEVICNQAFYTFIWIFHPLYMGLVLPCLYFGFIRWSRGQRSRSVLAVLYYMTAGSTIWINLTILPAVIEHRYQHSYAYMAMVGLVLSLVFVGMSRMIKSQQRWHSFELPTMKRLIRYFVILTAFTLFIVQLGDGHIPQYQLEIMQYFNASSPAELDQQPLRAVRVSNLPRLINQAGALTAASAMLVVGAVRRIRFVSCELRIQAGIAIAAAVAMGCLVANAAFSGSQAPSPVLATTVFCTAAYLDGVAEILTMVAVYEFVDVISPRTHKVLLIGIMFSVWSLASFIRYVIGLIAYDAVLPLIDTGPNVRYRATHAVGILLLVSCFIYTRFLSLPLSFTLKEEQLEGPTEEMPLMPVQMHYGSGQSPSQELDNMH